MDFEIKTLNDKKELSSLLNFISSQALSYPNYSDWVYNVCRTDLDAGYKKAYMAWHSGCIVGDLVFQPDKYLPRTLELKNLRIHPDFRRRALGYFLIKQVEADARGVFDQLIIDADSKQKDIHHLLTFSGFQVLTKQHLYAEDNFDYIFVKSLTKPGTGLWTP